MEPTYQLSDLINDCAVGVLKVSVLKNAMETAKSDFNFYTQEGVVGFIGHGGLEAPCLINTKLWENNPNPKNLIMVDAYHFYSGSIYGYIAFFYQPTTKKWIIKSFKKNSEPDTRNLTFKEALTKLQNQS